MKPQDLPDNFYFGGGADESSVTVLAFLVFLVAVGFVLGLPRKYAIYPFLLAALLIPMQQVLVIASFHLQLYRLVILAACIRIIYDHFSRGTRILPKLTLLDKLFLGWSFVNAVTYVLLWGVDAFSNRVGFLYSTLGAYFCLRYLIRDRDDIIRTIKALGVAAAIIAVGMFIEHQNGLNAFYSILGGIVKYSATREGKIRAQGPFQQSIVAGTFGAVLIPLFVILWKDQSKSRVMAAVGMVSSTVIAISCSSSTPLMTYVVGIFSLCLWPIRRRMRAVRWSIIAVLVALQITMSSPVWFVFARFGGIMGGTGWHRSELIDQFIRHTTEWFLIGTRDNASWGLDMWDCIDAYVRAGVDGGFITFGLFIAVIVMAYKRIGRARRLSEGNRADEFMAWGLGCVLVANTIAYFGIIYFDQSIISWYALLAMISAMSASATEARAERLKLRNSPAVAVIQEPSVAVPEIEAAHSGWTAKFLFPAS